MSSSASVLLSIAQRKLIKYMYVLCISLQQHLYEIINFSVKRLRVEKKNTMVNSDICLHLCIKKAGQQNAYDTDC